MFRKVIVANRGAVAARVLRSLAALRIPSVAVYSDADAQMGYLALAGETVRIGEGPARQSYLNQEAILDAARQAGCDALHPGYGFLSENAEFAQRVLDAGLCFIGPSPRHIAAMGHKSRARALAQAYGLPVARGSEVLPPDADAIRKAAAEIGYPVMIKPAAGGGGIGMFPAKNEAELLAAVERARSLAQRGFGNGDLYLERLLERPRHIEVQVLGDRHGTVRHLFERDCSIQRRNQKVIEESPAPRMNGEMDRLAEQVAQSLQRLGYDNIGTVEMLMGADGAPTFMEMNTRLQVEHGVTEEICGVDLVATQIRVAAGERLADILPERIGRNGHAIEARICAEDPVRFLPSAGTLTAFRFPAEPGLRLETGYAEGNSVTSFYDSLLAKLIAHAPTRDEAIRSLADALERTEIAGVKTNIPALLKLLRAPSYAAGDLHTGLLAETIH
jgi:acetyl-CoA carboxylase, biotin carboxylase subunit